MRRQPDRTRLLLFGALAILLAAGLSAMAWVQLRPKLAVPNWTEYLGENERASLEEAVDPSPLGAEGDTFLDMPGLRFVVHQSVRHRQGDMTVLRPQVQGKRQVGDDLVMRAILAFWKRRGLHLDASQPGAVTASAPNGNVYALRRARQGDDTGPMVWRFRTSAMPAPNAPIDDGRLGLLPPLPKGDENLELGNRGYAGYTQVFQINCPPRRGFRVLAGELEKRGWRFFEETGRLGQERGTVFQGALTAMMKHESAPLGCQVMVSAHPTRHDASQAFVALF